MFQTGGLRLCLILGLGPVVALAAQSQPSTVTLFSDAASNSQLVLNISQISGSCPGGQSGSGQISSLVLFGHDLTAVAGAAPPVPFQNLCIDAAGNVVGGSVKLSSDFSTPLIFGGLGLTLGQGTTLTVTNQTDSTCKSVPCLKFSGSGINLSLPLRDAAGTAAQVVIPDGSLAIAVGTGFSLKAQGLQLKNALADGAVGLGGFSFTLGAIDLDIARANGVTQTLTVTVHQPQVSVPLPIPGLLAQDVHGLTLKADTVAVNKSGEIEIAHGVAQNVNLPLAAPMDFILQAASVTFDKRFDQQDTVVTKDDCILTGAKLTLPAIVSDSNNNRVVLNVVGAEPGGGWDVTKTPVLAIDTPEIRLAWSGFGVQIPQGTKNLILDFSTSARDSGESSDLDASWQGVYVAKANLLLPKTFSDNGNDVSIQTTGLAIGNKGLSVTVNAPFPGGKTIQVGGGFSATLHDVGFKVVNNHVDAQSMKIDADVTLPILGATTWAMQFTDSGNFVLTLQNPSLDATLGGQSLFNGPDLGGLHFDLTNATLQLPGSAGALGAVHLSGALSLQKPAGTPSDLAAALGGIAVSFTDLGIDTQGRFILPPSGQFTLSHPIDIDLKVMKLDLTSLSAGNKDDANHSPFLLLNGGVTAGEGLPVSAEVDFSGLEVSAAGGVSMNGLEVKTDVADVLRLDAMLQHVDKSHAVWPTGPTTAPVGCFQKTTNHTHVPISCLQGSLELSLNLGALSMGTGATGFTFEAASGAWLFTGGMGLPGGGIPLGQSNTSLFKFRGGVGYKAQAADQTDQPSPSAHIGESSYIVYLDPTLPGDDLLFTVGTSVGSSADSGFTFMADADAIVTTDPFTLDLSARAMFQELPGTTFDQADRTAYMDIRYVAPDTLHATAGANLYYPTRSIDLVDAHGTMDLLLSPSEAHFFLGWPPSTNPIAVNIGLNGVEKFTFSGGLGVHILGSGTPAIDADPYSGGTGPWFAAALAWHGELGPLSADISGNADISLQASGQINTIVGSVAASGQADFGPFSASATGVLTLAYLAKNQAVNLPTADGGSQTITASNGDEIYADGEVKGCGSVFGLSKCLNLDVSDTLD